MMPRVLLVEDDRPTLGTLKIMFARMGVQTRVAMSLAEALRAINDPLDFIFRERHVNYTPGVVAREFCH
jgi:DNA-binding response OmpR family regulator